MLEVVFDRPFLLGPEKLRRPRLAGAQLVALLVLAVPGLERVLRQISQLPDGQADALAQLDVQLHGSKPVLV